jgi:uncharacterized membrane protein
MEIITLFYKSPILIILLIIFIICKIFTPKNINDIYGYRSFNSKKNKSNWDFAQKYSTNLFITLLLVMIGLQIIIYYIDKSNPYIEIMPVIGFIIIAGIVLFKTEQKLKKMPS